mgnify:CR=1 FL=1
MGPEEQMIKARFTHLRERTLDLTAFCVAQRCLTRLSHGRSGVVRHETQLDYGDLYVARQDIWQDR